MAAQVCIYGKDRALVEIRAEVLRKAGFEAAVDCTDYLQPANQVVAEVAVLCNSLCRQEQIDLARVLRAHAPEKKILILLPLGGGASYPVEIGQMIEASPAGLVAAVAGLVG